MATNFDPYYQWLGIAPDEQPANYYRLLGVRLFESEPSVIQNAADSRMIHLRTFQNGPHSRQSQQLLSEIAIASQCLLVPAQKLAYDQQLRLQLNPPQMQPQVQQVLRPIPVQLQLPQQLPPPIPVQPAAAVATNSEPLPSLGFSTARSSHRSAKKNPVVEIVKVVLGGAAGLALGGMILWFGFGADPSGLFAKLMPPKNESPNSSAKSVVPGTTSAGASLPGGANPSGVNAGSPPVAQPVGNGGTSAGNSSPGPAGSAQPGATQSASNQPGSTPPGNPPPSSADLGVDLANLTAAEVNCRDGIPAVMVLGGLGTKNAIFHHPQTNLPSSKTFDIQGKYTRVIGGAGLNLTAAGKFDGEIRMKIYGDDRIRWISQPIKNIHDFQKFEVDITNVKSLRLVVEATKDLDDAHALWFVPKLFQDPAGSNRQLPPSFFKPDSSPGMVAANVPPRNFGLAAPKQGVPVSKIDPLRPVYLSELQYIDFDAYEMRPLRVSIRGKRSPHGIFLHPNTDLGSRIVYQLERKFRMLTGAVSQNDSATDLAFTPLTMRVVGDGQVLWASRPIRSVSDVQAFQVDITGVNQLQLEVVCPGNNGKSHAVWFGVLANPELRIDNPELATLFPEFAPTSSSTPLLADLLQGGPVQKIARPDDAAITAAQKTMEEVLGDLLTQATTPELKTQLADKLFELGSEPGQAPADQFVVLRAAVTSSFTVDQFLRAIVRLESTFEGSFLAEKIAGLHACKTQAVPQTITSLAEYVMKSVAEAEQSDQFDRAFELGEIGQAIGKKLGDRRLSEAFANRAKHTEVLQAAYKVCQPLFETLKTDPTNAEAAMKCGQYLALVREDWQTALPLLAQGTENPALAAVAIQELEFQASENSSEVVTLVKLGDGWWNLSETSPPLSKDGYRKRSAYWYAKAKESGLRGLDLEKVNKRLSEKPSDWLASWRPFSPEALVIKQVAAKYHLFVTNFSTKQRRQLPDLEFTTDYRILDISGNEVGTWAAEEQRLLCTFRDTGDGTAELQFVPRSKSWIGRHSRSSDRTVWGWELLPD
ncbi:Glycosyl hydrolase family 98 putative carbohydrate binding module [Pirellula staleyi DSM 6068]|uniref:Glycosyl hydrolase family 98 putative carbohydrate binding module n=1 Tax=Pirellula staleyi (strain ATCC 27377 / DSM 6068 / ICPB 4128) TaxID=530564 RepID=D2R3J4_PIRSD|nr:NPCBM/NEW2 domain-containing protein [Pirellula staleyi]ADB16948.1 Glycosyl hydrolase family 98 putative carbohydrate binding module [Pirellula staleyi DSM 6068]